MRPSGAGSAFYPSGNVLMGFGAGTDSALHRDNSELGLLEKAPEEEEVKTETQEATRVDTLEEVSVGYAFRCAMHLC